MNIDDRKTAPLWRIVLGWGGAAIYGLLIILCLSQGYVVVGKHEKVQYTRSHEPAMYWLVIALYLLVFGIVIHSLVNTKPTVAAPTKPDLTPRDWMGNPLNRK